MTLPEQTLTIIAVAAAALAVLLTIATIVLFARLRRLRRSYESVLRPGEADDLFEIMNRQLKDVEALRADLGTVHENTEHLRQLIRASVSRVGVVRYDAFEDMGGALSFSAALLDEHGDGVVFTTINGRSEARTYAKPIQGGDSEMNLSPEEASAVENAMTSQPGSRPVETSRRRRRRAAS